MNSGNEYRLFKLFATFCFLAIIIFCFAPKQGMAAGYVPLAPIEGTLIPGTTQTDLPTYLVGMFKVGVAGAGVLAFLMIVWGGFTYLSTDAITGKEEGKARITRAVGGLILALTSYIILNTINPQLVILDLYFGKPADPKNMLSGPKEYNPSLIDQTLAKLETASAEREKKMTEEAAALRAKAAQLKALAEASTAPGAEPLSEPEREAPRVEAADLEREAALVDLDNVANGKERLATENALNAYTPEKLDAALIRADKNIGEIQQAYLDARNYFGRTDSTKLPALVTDEMNKISVIRKSEAFGTIDTPPLREGYDYSNRAEISDKGIVAPQFIDEAALNRQIATQMANILKERNVQVQLLSGIKADNPNLSTEISARNANIHKMANDQICQIKVRCKDRGYTCYQNYPNIPCTYN